MNLRLLTLALLLANSAYFAWSQGALAPLGLTPVPPGESERLRQHIKPEGWRAEQPPAKATVDSAPAQPMPEAGATPGLSPPAPAR